MPDGLRDRALRFKGHRIGEGQYARGGGWDPVERLKDMAADGVSTEVLYPTRGSALAPTLEDAFELAVEILDRRRAQLVEHPAHVDPTIGVRGVPVPGGDLGTSRRAHWAFNSKWAWFGISAGGGMGTQGQQLDGPCFWSSVYIDEQPVAERGRLTTCDDPEIREIASKYGNPDGLLEHVTHAQ